MIVLELGICKSGAVISVWGSMNLNLKSFDAIVAVVYMNSKSADVIEAVYLDKSKGFFFFF